MYSNGLFQMLIVGVFVPFFDVTIGGCFLVLLVLRIFLELWHSIDLKKLIALP